MFPSILWEIWVLLMWVFSPCVPQAKAANPYNEINQNQTPRSPTLTQAAWNSMLNQKVVKRDMRGTQNVNVLSHRDATGTLSHSQI